MSQRVSWVLAVALLLADLVLHKPISNLCDWMAARWGFGHYNHAALLVLSVSCGAIVAVQLVRLRRHLRRPALIAALLLLVALTVAAHQYLLVANIELIHFPQYALIAAVLMAGGVPPKRAWLAATVAGVIDESYQELFIYFNTPGTYLDFNDMILNAIGAAWAAALLAPMARRTDGRTRRRRAASATLLPAAAAAPALALLCYLDPPSLAHFWRRAATGRDYHVLSPIEALALALLLRGILALSEAGAPVPRPATQAPQSRRATEEASALIPEAGRDP